MTTKDMTVESVGWRRLDPRMLLVNLRWLLPPLGIIALTALASGGVNWAEHKLQIVSALLFVGLTCSEMIRWRTTRFRVSDEQVEVSSGLFWRRHVAIPRDRVRTVDVTSGPVHRIFGLSIVTMGTGQALRTDRRDQVKLDAVATAEAATLRAGLLPRAPAPLPAPAAPQKGPTLGKSPAPVPTSGPEKPVSVPATVELARVDPAWIRYAPLSPLVFVIGLAPLTQAYNLAERLGIPVDIGGAVLGAIEFLEEMPGWLYLVLFLLMLIAGAIGTMLLFTESWWKFRLVREPGSGTLRVSRGLLTTRSFTLEERRLRGAELIEPFMLRWGRGARLKAIASGLRQTMDGPRGGSGALLPPAPRRLAHLTAASVLGEQESPLLPERLRAHPRAALRRRLTRAAVASVAAIAAAAVLAVLAGWSAVWPAVIAAVVVVPVSLLLAADSYRSLGHTLSGAYLVTRSGVLLRRTVALQRGGIIGWTVTRSPLQRRAGLANIAATTAAGTLGAYTVRDVDYGDGLVVAGEAVPGLLAQFIEVTEK
ncbi:PH domain-containing protein [Nonomuraea rosea]|uniref:PH domain-containing protein n=1 Tax=Nonomuraea rosea TaxID=638574 RepID=A0ABP6YUY6_9ACTN